MIVNIFEVVSDTPKPRLSMLTQYNTDVRSATVPRVGEQVNYKTRTFEVIHVLYVVDRQTPSVGVFVVERRENNALGPYIFEWKHEDT